jgi:uncharacterized protein YndB with AHSA1/START domain
MSVITPLGRVLPDELGMRLEFVRLLDHPVDEVWQVLTVSERLGEWFGTWTGDPASGSVLLRPNELPDDAYPDAVEIVVCTPPHRLSVIAPQMDDPWPLTVELQPRGENGTFLMFTQRLNEPYDASSIGPGWHYYLDRMEAVLAGTSLPDVWEEYFPALAESYALPADASSGETSES